MKNRTFQYKSDNKGYSLIEMLVVLFVFAILGAVVTQALAVSLRNSKKGENITLVRQEIGNAVSVMEYNLRTATNISCTGDQISYTDEWGGTTSFNCASGQISSGSAILTSSKVNITNCPSMFLCGAGIEVVITAEDKSALGTEGSRQTFTTFIAPRNE